MGLSSAADLRSTVPAAPPIGSGRYWRSCFGEHRDLLQRCETELAPAFDALVADVVAVFCQGGLMMLCGNGGSAADAQHIAAEFTVRFVRDRRALRALALATDCSSITASGNDLGFDQVFSRQVDAHGRPGDLLIGISTSGNSPNVLAAFDAARAGGIRTVALTGAGGGRAAERADLVLAVPSGITARVQEMHILIGHALCGAVERELGLPT